MPTYGTRVQGLKGLKGLNSLSTKEQEAWLKSNADILPDRYHTRYSKYREIADRVYRNQLFSNLFKDTKEYDALKQLSPDQRDNVYQEYLVNRNFVNTFKNDDDFNTLNAELDTQGKLDLLQSDYLGSVERKKRLAKRMKEAETSSKNIEKMYSAGNASPFIDNAYSNQQIFIDTEKVKPFNKYDDESEKDKNVRDKLFAETQERREKGVDKLKGNIYTQMLLSDQNGKKSLAQTYKEWDSFATKHSPHYATFKNTKWLKDYTQEDRLADYAQYQALASIYGEGVAEQYLDRSIQNRVAKAQDGKWTGNTLKKIATTAYSDIGSNIALAAHIDDLYDPERMGMLNQGLDPDTGKEDKNWFTNPAYWNDVYKYNTFSPTELKLIKERGGISEDVNVREYGYTPDFFSWDTAEEGFSQSGHIIAGIVETGLTGAAGKAVGSITKGALKMAGVSAKMAARLGKVGAITNDVLVTATTGLEGSQMEAMGTFDEQIQEAKEKIKDQIGHELQDYQRNINYNTKEARAVINKYYDELKRRDERRLKQSKGEGTMALPLSEEALRNQAKNIYTSQLLKQEEERLNEVHKKDLEEASKIAAQAYAANFALDYIKNIPITTGIQRFKIAKGSMRGVFDNTVERSVVNDIKTGGLKKIKNWASAKEITKGFGKQVIGGFEDEYLDGLNATFAGGMSSRMFDNYINKNYNPETYSAVVDNFAGNLLAGISEGINGITDRENLYEGFIGAMSPFVSGMVSPQILFTPHDTWNAVVHGVDERGNKLNWGERMSQIFTNPLLNTYAELKEKDRRVSTAVDAINTIVEANKESLQNVSRLLYTLGDYKGEVYRDRVKTGQETDAATLLDYKDKKLYDAFTLIGALNTLSQIDGSSKAGAYKSAMEILEGLAKSTLQGTKMEQEIDKFLAEPDNKSIVDQGPEKAREIAKERLQKNAQYFMNMKDKMTEVQRTLDNSQSMKNIDPRIKQMLLYNLVAEDDYKERLKSIEKEIGGSNTSTDQVYTPNYKARYGTKESKQQAIDARDRIIKDFEAQRQKVNDKIESNAKELEKLKKDRYKDQPKEQKQETLEKIAQLKNLQKSLEFQRQQIEENIAQTKAEQSSIKELLNQEESAILSETEILSLDARDRAYMLNPDNLKKYSKEQQEVIKRVRTNLEQKNPDALTQIRDAGILADRISDLKTVHEKLLSNSGLAATYIDAVEKLRDKNAMMEALQDDIDKNYTKLEEVYQNREKDPTTFQQTVKGMSGRVLGAYIKDHADQKDALQPYLDLLKYEEDIVNTIKQKGYSEEETMELLTTTFVMHNNSNNAQEAATYLEKLIDDPSTSKELKSKLNDILQRLETLGYQRDATVIRKRGEEDKKKKEKIAEEKKKEQKAKDEAQVLAEEEEIAKKELENGNGTLEEVNLFGDEYSAESTNPQNEEKTNAEQQKVSEKQQLFNQITDWLKKIGIPVHNKTEMEAFLKEHGVDDVETWLNNYYKKIKNKEDAAVIGHDLFQRYKNESAYGVVSRSANNWYLCDYFGEGSYRMRETVQIDGNEEDLNAYEQEIKQKNLTFRSAADFSRSFREFANRNRQRSNGNVSVQGRSTNNGTSAMDRGQLDGKTYSNTEGNNGRSTENISRSEIQELRTPDGELYGFTYNGEIYIDETKLSPEVPIHEYTHLWDKAVMKIKPELWNRGKELMKELRLWDQILQDENYGRKWKAQSKTEEEIEDLIASEVHARLTGEEGEKILLQIAKEQGNQNIISKVKKWLLDIWKTLKSTFDSNMTQEELDKLTLKDFIHMTVRDFVGGINPNTVTANTETTNATENVEDTKGVENSVNHSTNTAVAPVQGNIIDNGDIVQIETPTLEQQVANNGDLNSAIQNINSAKNADEQNVKNKNISSTLSGNAMSEWQMEPLITEGKLTHKQGKEPTDAMSTFYSWLDAAGIKLQNIIDQELGIILRNNPHAKVKFMSVQQLYNATHDNYTKEKLFLVLDFDDTVNEDITKIHNNKNGGVIESNGKKYLIIGVAGYGNGKNKERQELYNILFGANPHSITGLGIVKKGQKDFFDAHPNERFYVNDVISTEIVPQSLIPGYRVKQQEEDDNATYRKLSDLLHDKDRNPQEYELDDLGFGIQKGEYYSVVNVKVENVMPPSSPETSIGRVFVLIPAGNGKLMPAYIKPLFYRELKDCKLKKDIDSLLEGLIAPSYAKRYQAYLDLCQYLHLTKEGHSFLLRKKSQEISLVKNGIVFKTFVLNESFNRQEFFDAIMDMNPRISITENTLRSRTLLKEYDEAGALMTDIAQLGTAGSSYDIFAVDGDGRMVEPTSNVYENKQQQSNLSELRHANTIQIPYNGEFYIGTNGFYTLNSEVITDETIIEQLRYNEQIIRGHIAPTSIKGIYGWHIISTNKDNPIVVKVNNNTHEVKVLDKATADIYIDHIQKEKQEVERKEAAQDKLQEENNAENASLVSIEEVDLGLTEEDDERIDLKELETMNLEEVDLGLDEKTENSDIDKSSTTVESNTESKKTVEKEPNKQPIVDIFEKNRGVSTEELLRRQRHEGQQTLTFLEVLKDRRYMKRLVNIIYSKWKDAPKMLDALSQFLKEKNIEVDSIPNTEEDIETWIETLEDCR